MGFIRSAKKTILHRRQISMVSANCRIFSTTDPQAVSYSNQRWYSYNTPKIVATFSCFSPWYLTRFSDDPQALDELEFNLPGGVSLECKIRSGRILVWNREIWEPTSWKDSLRSSSSRN